MKKSLKLFYMLLPFVFAVSGCDSESSLPQEAATHSVERSVHENATPRVSHDAKPEVTADTGSPPGPEPHFYGRVKVLCIGINDYRYINAPLNEAEADALAFGETLKRDFGYEPRYLLGRDAKKSAIENEITEMGNSLGTNEALIIFFACHGISFERIQQVENIPVPTRVGYLLPNDADVQIENPQDPAWDAEAVNMRSLVDTVEALKADHVLLVADCCCSGFLTKRGSADIAEHISLLTDRSRTILAATTQHQTAAEGIFTKNVLGVLTRYSKNVEAASVADLFDEIHGPVIRESEREMRPQMSHVGEGDGEFVFFPLTISTGEVNVVKKEVAKARADGTSSETALASLSRGLLSGVVERANKRAGRWTNIKEVSAAMSAPNYWYGLNAAEKTNYWRAMRERFRKNAGWGDPLAMAGLHFCYSRGLGEADEQPNHEAAYHWALTADQVRGSSGIGKFLLGRCYKLGIGISQNDAAGRALYKESAKDGFILGALMDGQHSLRESPTAENAAKYIPILQEGVDAGIAYAAGMLGDVYATGRWGVRPDLLRAIKAYEEALSLGHVGVTLALFDAYSLGAPGYPAKDLPRAEAYLRDGAEAGVGDCQFFLGIELLQTPGFDRTLELTKDPTEAVRWLELAGQQKNVRALIVLAEQYAYGRDPNLGTDFKKARTFVEQAVALNSSLALVTQGNFYLGDFGVYEHDEEKALKCFEQAAALDDPVGCDMAGRLYYAGIGVVMPDKFRVTNAFHPKSHVAMHWYMRALKAGGNDHSEEQLKRFSGLIQREQQGVVTTPGFEPSFVLETWRQTFPATAKAFEERFLDRETIANNAARADDATRAGQDVPVVDTKAIGLRLQEEGHALLKSKNYRRAYEVLSESIALDPKNCYTFHLRGNASKQLGKMKDALADYNAAIEINPMESRFYVSRANLLWDMGDFVGMRRDAEKAVRLEPDYGKSHFLLGNAHFRIGNFDEAIAAYDTAVARGLNADIKPQAYHNRGVAWERKGEQSKAEQDFRRARQLGFGR